MRPVRSLAVFSLALLLVSSVRGADQKLEVLQQPPAGLSAEVAAAISETGYRISDSGKVVCDVWFAKEAPLKPKFKSSLRIKYPFQAGQLIGAIRFPDGSKPNDFRGQELKPGLYTLRYGLQPDDGNHLGTSDIRDFLVGCSPKEDTNPKRIEDIKALFKLSGSAAGTTHPAIFLLFPPPEKPIDSAAIHHEAEKKLLILDSNIQGKDADKSVAIPLRIVLVGKSDG
ncbi:MAG: hypothetical protein ACKV0T_14940 [Planctomycetales bacterium]